MPDELGVWRRGSVILAVLWFLLWHWQTARATWTPQVAIRDFSVKVKDFSAQESVMRTIEQPNACQSSWRFQKIDDNTWEISPECSRRQHANFQITGRKETSSLHFSSGETLSHAATILGSGWASLQIDPHQTTLLRAEGAPFSPSQIGMVLVQEPGEGPDFDPEPYATNLGNWQLYPSFSDGALGTENCHSLSALFQPRQEWPCRFGSSDGLTRQKPP